MLLCCCCCCCCLSNIHSVIFAPHLSLHPRLPFSLSLSLFLSHTHTHSLSFFFILWVSIRLNALNASVTFHVLFSMLFRQSSSCCIHLSCCYLHTHSLSISHTDTRSLSHTLSLSRFLRDLKKHDQALSHNTCKHFSLLSSFFHSRVMLVSLCFELVFWLFQ